VTAGPLAGDLSVLVVGALACVAPVASRPTLQFGVRVPPEQAGAPVIRRERRAYYWRTAAIGACCTTAALTLQGHGSWWLPRIILLLELAADFGCFWVARRKIAAAKHADGWFAGLRQTIATDTSWRTDPPRFPVRWLIPALAVIAATAAVGALRYPGLPAHLVTGSGHRAPKAAVIVLVVAFQLYVTVLWTGFMLIIYRSRPDIEAADPAASTLRYRRFLAAITRTLLTPASSKRFRNFSWPVRLRAPVPVSLFNCRREVRSMPATRCQVRSRNSAPVLRLPLPVGISQSLRLVAPSLIPNVEACLCESPDLPSLPAALG